ncbi:MAG: DUF4258 domain-containing protein [Chloroflexi bacterium]|nr:DUF4258 domain-containing protein [Chloroflexota bacterium]
MPFRLTRHAEEELQLRNIPVGLVREVVESPSRLSRPSGPRKPTSRSSRWKACTFLLRVIVDDATNPITVVTVYRTKKISKYWRATQ